MDTRDPIYRLMTAEENEAHDKLPLEEKEYRGVLNFSTRRYQKYLVRIRLFPPYDKKTLTREEFYEKFKKELASASGPPAAAPPRTAS